MKKKYYLILNVQTAATSRLKNLNSTEHVRACQYLTMMMSLSLNLNPNPNPNPKTELTLSSSCLVGRIIIASSLDRLLGSVTSVIVIDSVVVVVFFVA